MRVALQAHRGARTRAPAARRPRSLGSRRWTGPLVADLALAVRSDPFSRPGWIYELKYDGWRALAAKNDGRVTLRLRSGREATSMFPEVVDAMRALPAERALIDGELGRLRPRWAFGFRAAATAGVSPAPQHAADCREHVRLRPARPRRTGHSPAPLDRPEASSPRAALRR
jgi:hypothetical protein